MLNPMFSEYQNPEAIAIEVPAKSAFILNCIPRLPAKRRRSLHFSKNISKIGRYTRQKTSQCTGDFFLLFQIFIIYYIIVENVAFFVPGF